MDPVRIVHLSDPHFSPGKEMDVWAAVVSFINDTVKPDAIVITGDVTDNATEKEFLLARDKLALLKIKNEQQGQPQYRIVPGNHDRYALLGNNWLNYFRRILPGFKAKRFEQYFSTNYPTPDAVANLPLGGGNNLWQIRVIGIDSNQPSCWFAQGAVKEPMAVSAAQCALNASDSDLVLVLVHHHVLPIPAVERAAANYGVANVANVTGLLNAGTLLEHLSAAQVNIVLHGHEHERNLARFSGSGLNAGTTVVLAAGSGTGEKTLEGWALSRVHFNVLELESDRSVYLREARLESAGLSLGPRKILLTGAAIRQSRFVRRNRVQDRIDRSLPTSRLKKLFLLNNDRSATIVESRTDIAIRPEWSLTTKSASGHLDGMANVEFVWGSGATQQYAAPFVAAENGDHEAFTCGLDIDVQHPVLLKRATVQWRWACAALLTKSDGNLLPPSALTGLRKEGREFVALRVGTNEEFEECSITLGMPAEYSPQTAEFRVDWESPREPGQLQYSEELTHALEFCGPGHVELRVPFPAPGYCYYLSWALPADDDEYGRAQELSEALLPHADDFRQQALQEVGAGLNEHSIRVTLYGLCNEKTWRLKRLNADADAPDSFSLLDARSRARSAIFGDAQVIGRGETGANDYLQPDEHILLLVPVAVAVGDAGPHPALLRVATKEESGLEWDPEMPISGKLSDLIERAYLAAAHIAHLAQLN